MVSKNELAIKIEKKIELPMIILALLVIPLVLIELEIVPTNPYVVSCATMIDDAIWFAFLFEYLILVSLYDDKVGYTFYKYGKPYILSRLHINMPKRRGKSKVVIDVDLDIAQLSDKVRGILAENNLKTTYSEIFRTAIEIAGLEKIAEAIKQKSK